MREKLIIILTVVIIVGLLVGINLTTYIDQEEVEESELSPNRSTYHAGLTGTRALYDLLSESGYKVMRWRELPVKLLSDEGQKVKTFVVIGRAPLSFDQEQADNLLAWVKLGGRLVIIDRQPDFHIIPASGAWTMKTAIGTQSPSVADPEKPEQLTENVKPVPPVQPTFLTHDIESVIPSVFAATINFSRSDTEDGSQAEDAAEGFPSANEHEKPAPSPSVVTVTQDNSTPASPAPVVHLADSKGALLIDYPHGQGRIILLSEPYIFSNHGIRLKDNLQLAINMLASSEGLIAFDEYHQGRGITRNALISYFSGTPVIPVLAQVVLLILLVLWTRGRRFARPLPLPQVDRRSSLEFVASMAELQRRARAFDLAIENIYMRTRRVLSRYAGVDYNSPRSEISSRVAARSSLESQTLEALMRQCEEAINSGHVTEQQALHLVQRLRKVERVLGLRMRRREVKQAAQKI